MKIYTKPELKISVFATEDIITTSAVDDDTVTKAPLTVAESLTEEYTDNTYDNIF